MARPRIANEDMVMSLSVDTLVDEVVVKFTAQYHPKAHHLLAAEGFAPALHACVPVCGKLFMVVMDHVCREMAFEAGRQGELLPHDIYKDIQNAIALLHTKNLVFGNLCIPNIMVIPPRPGSDTRYRANLIDFDWVGVHRSGRYPASLNEGLSEWLETGVQL